MNSIYQQYISSAGIKPIQTPQFKSSAGLGKAELIQTKSVNVCAASGVNGVCGNWSCGG